MANCVFPTCKLEAGVDVIPARKEYCKTHERAICAYSNVRDREGKPLCVALTVLYSAWCQAHNDMMIFAKFAHGILHQEAALAAQAQQQGQRIAQAILSPNGKPADLRRLKGV